MSQALLCWNCGASLDGIVLPLSRHNNCPKCFEVLHCCRLCSHYAPGKPTDCNHERSDPPVIKESSNFCEYFKPSCNAFDPKSKQNSNSAQSDFDALFSDATPVEQSSNPLDDLFD